MTSTTAGAAPERPTAFRIWLLAIRPATLPAALSGVVVGLGAALAVATPFRLDAAIGCFAVALLLQITANLANDLSDFRKGADTPDRTGPIRVAAAGLVTERQLEVAIGLTIGLAGLVGLWLTLIGGPILLVIGALAIVAALAYTGGPWPYGYRGLGEVFVFVFFGLVAVGGTAYLQAGRLEPLFIAAAIPVGALTTAILVVNNLRDIPTDAAAGKRTLAVVLGRRATVIEYAAVAGGGVVVPVALAIGGRGITVLLPVLAAPLASPVAADRPHLQRAPPAQPRAQGDRPAGADLQPAVRRRAGARERRRVTTARALVADRVRIPFRRPFATASGMWVERDAWIIRLFDRDGRVGLGEAVLASEPGEVADTILTALIREAAESTTTTGLPTMTELEGHGAPGRALNAALESATADLDRPGAPDLAPDGDGVGVNATLPSLGPAALAEAAQQSIESGFETLKVKAGAERETEVLVERIRAIRTAVGPDVRLRIDVNGAWDLATAEERLEAIARFDIEFVEQPLAAHDLDGLAELRRRVTVPIAADEAAESLAAVRTLLAMRRGRRARDQARPGRRSIGRRRDRRRWQPRAACRSSSARCSRRVSGSRRRWPWRHPCPRSGGRAGRSPPDHGLATAGLLEHDLLTESLVVAEGRMRVPATPGSGGLGITLDERALERFRVERIGSPP